MKIGLSFVIFSILVCGTLTALGQEESIVFRHFTGVVTDSENQPLAGAAVCGWNLSGRPLGGRIPCAESKADGHFELSITRWEGDTYSLWAYDIKKGYADPMSGFYERSLVENSIEVNGANESEPVEIHLKQKTGKMILTLVDNENGQPVESGLITLCRIDDPDACQSTSTSFPKGIYEFLTPKSAFTLKMKWHDGREWKDWIVMDKNHNLIETLQVDPGKSQNMTIRLRK